MNHPYTFSPDGSKVQLGVIEFHSERSNPGLIKRFYEVTDDLRRSGSIVDVWLMDIAEVLREHGYLLEIRRSQEKEEEWENRGP